MFCIVPKNSDKVIVVDDDGNVSVRDKTTEDELLEQKKLKLKAKKNDSNKPN